jgi:hypothetical protein
MYDVKIRYWKHHRHEDKRLVDDAAYEKRQAAAIKVKPPREELLGRKLTTDVLGVDTKSV